MSDLVYRLRKRAEIRRQIDTRKSVQNNEPDRIADLLEESADRIEQLEKLISRKPVAWMSPDGKVSTTEGKLFHIPLYTHPHKELSDEEYRKHHEGFSTIIKASRGEE
jgi:hypothetical protein